MATKGELMRSGLSWEAANCIGQDLDATTETATGTNQATAFAIKASITYFGTVGASTGAVLPSATGQGIFAIVNGGANALTVYPNGTETFTGGATSFSVTNAKSAIFIPHGNQWVANLSA